MIKDPKNVKCNFDQKIKIGRTPKERYKLNIKIIGFKIKKPLHTKNSHSLSARGIFKISLGHLFAHHTFQLRSTPYYVDIILTK